MPRPPAALRTLGLARASVVSGLAITTVVFTVMSAEGHGGAALGGILIQVLLISFAQDGLTRGERVGFSLAAVALGLLAVVTGALIAAA